MTLSSLLSWSLHINYITLKCKRILGMLSRYKHLWSRSALEVCYISFIRLILEYGNILYDCCSIADSTVLEGVQLDAIRLVTGAKRCTSHAAMYRELGWINLKTRRKIHRLIKFDCIVNNLTPIYLQLLIEPLVPRHDHRTRLVALNNFIVMRCTSMYKSFFINSTTQSWNNLALSIRNCPPSSRFKIIYYIFTGVPVYYSITTLAGIYRSHSRKLERDSVT